MGVQTWRSRGEEETCCLAVFSGELCQTILLAEETATSLPAIFLPLPYLKKKKRLQACCKLEKKRLPFSAPLENLGRLCVA